MTLDAALSSAHRELVQAFTALESAGTANDALLDAVAAKLTHLKVLLTERDLLYPEALDVATHAEALVLARDVLEMGAFWSLRKKDLAQFDRYWSQLKPFYLDLVDALPASQNYEPMLGLSLMRDLSANAIAAFHMALESLPVALVQSSPYLQHPVLLERWLMEGSYSNVWHGREKVPREEYRFFVDMLMVTIRHEIASAEEKAYDTLPLNDVATLLFFSSPSDVLAFAQERGWHVNPTTQTVEFANKKAARDAEAHDAIPRRATIAMNLHFAKELESIV